MKLIALVASSMDAIHVPKLQPNCARLRPTAKTRALPALYRDLLAVERDLLEFLVARQDACGAS